MKKKIVVLVVVIVLTMILFSGCIYDDVKEETITGIVTNIDVGGSPAFPFGVVTFDNGRVFSPLIMHAYGMLSKYLNKRVTVTFIPAEGRGAWYDIEDIR